MVRAFVFIYFVNNSRNFSPSRKQNRDSITPLIRPISQPERRLSECARLGFTDVYLPKRSLRGISIPDSLRVTGVDTVMEALFKLGLTAR